jgi:hypothetical protein
MQQVPLIERMDRYVKRVTEIVHTVETLAAAGPTTPALLFLHAAMDAISSWSRPVDQADTSREIFKNWIDKYMLFDSGLPCTSDDIYGARCGLLHNLTLCSRLSRQGKARELLFSSHVEFLPLLKGYIKEYQLDVCIVVFPVYVRAFYKALIRFAEALQVNPDLQDRVLYWFNDVATTDCYEFRNEDIARIKEWRPAE